MMRLFLSSSFLLLASCASSPKASHSIIRNTSLLWEVTGNNARDTSYLFGTFHAFKGGFVDTMKPVTSRLAKSTAIVGEIDLSDPSAMMGVAGSMMSDKPLKQLLSPSEYKKADSIFKWASGYGLGFFNSMKPMAAQAQLVKSMFDKIYPTHSHPDEPILDLYFQKKAQLDNRPIYGLESIEDQVELLFNGFAVERQAAMLMESIDDFDSGKIMMKQLADCYVTADMDCLEAMGNEAEGFTPAEMEALVKTRNENWMKALPQIMRDHRAFVAVGALHLPGEFGVVNLLRKRGYIVTPIPIR